MSLVRTVDAPEERSALCRRVLEALPNAAPASSTSRSRRSRSLIRTSTYGRTRRFYQACWFRPLEELAAIWGEENPCLIMVERLEP